MSEMQDIDYKKRLEMVILKLTLTKKHSFSYAELIRMIAHYFPELKSDKPKPTSDQP